MDFNKVFVTNKKKEEEGVWMPGPDGSSFLIARAGNTKMMKLAGILFKPHRRLIQMGKADDKIVTEIAAEVTSRTVLLNWKGMTEKGVEIPYSQEEAKKRLIESQDFADFISGLAQQASAFQDEEREDAVKNS